jgi:hypothetical protein
MISNDAPHPTLDAYLEPTQYEQLVNNHTTNELANIERALDEIEAMMILIHRNAEYTADAMILEAICSIWDNARDLAFDE